MKLHHTLLALTLSALSANSLADSLPKQMSMPTDVGEVVLTVEPCDIAGLPEKYQWRAFATEAGHEDHPGCWTKNVTDSEAGPMQSVAVFFPEISATAVFNPQLFKPRANY
jgi:hypothetical protein